MTAVTSIPLLVYSVALLFRYIAWRFTLDLNFLGLPVPVTDLILENWRAMVLLVLGVRALFVLHRGLKFLRLKGKDILNIDRLLYY